MYVSSSESVTSKILWPTVGSTPSIETVVHNFIVARNYPPRLFYLTDQFNGAIESIFNLKCSYENSTIIVIAGDLNAFDSNIQSNEYGLVQRVTIPTPKN